ncbi:hypothetical protein [Prosthecobacter fusiformis]|uniref:hypothetical protein n=1 Tax=Prosthecobacter fusiformis TaxID=48464 RepID=UPI001AAE534D|nr:hypothetical protein [Prosthecobacter fusiformis]
MQRPTPLRDLLTLSCLPIYSPSARLRQAYACALGAEIREYTCLTGRIPIPSPNNKHIHRHHGYP